MKDYATTDVYLSNQEEDTNKISQQKINDLLLRKNLLLKPNYIAKSAWLEHIPFAFWLTEAIKPKKFVELGTHYGSSYFAFCQAVANQEWEAQCFAVDTWQGDEHAGTYGGEVYTQVYEHNRKYYAHFSTLIKSSFDQALPHFADGSIDLLHIDGLHTFEAVCHDFESWMPKLSDQAVVIMHDTNVRKNGFGVFKLFEDLGKKYPNFEFSHGNGLGIIGVGIKQTEMMQQFFSLSLNRSATRYTRDLFSYLGRACSDNWENNSIKEEHTCLKNSLSEIEDLLKKEKKQTSILLNDLLSEKEKKRVLEEKIIENEKNIQDRYEELSIVTKIAESYHLDLESNKSQLLNEKEKIKNIHSSLSWKITKPIRALHRLIMINHEKDLNKDIKLVMKSNLFDEEWYLNTYPDVKESGMNPAKHYLLYGGFENRNPSVKFNSQRYLEQHYELKDTGTNPLIHHLKNEKIERYKSEDNSKKKDDFLILPERNKDKNIAGSGYVRTIYPYSHESFQLHKNVIILDGSALPNPGEAKYILIQRKGGEFTLTELKNWHARWRSAGGKLIYEIDDNLIDAEGLVQRGFDGDTKVLCERIMWLVKNADLVIVSTNTLKDLFVNINTNTHVVPNRLDANLWKIDSRDLKSKHDHARNTSSSIKIGYIGTTTHIQDLKVVETALKRIEDEYGEKVEIEVVGAFQNTEPLFGRRIELPNNSIYPVFVDWLHTQINWDIGIIPLVDDDFNKSKSYLKFLEYTALGLPVIVSESETYAPICRHNVNCLLAKNDTESWYQAIKRLIENQELRKNIYENAMTELKKEHILPNKEFTKLYF